MSHLREFPIAPHGSVFQDSDGHRKDGVVQGELAGDRTIADPVQRGLDVVNVQTAIALGIQVSQAVIADILSRPRRDVSRGGEGNR